MRAATGAATIVRVPPRPSGVVEVRGLVNPCRFGPEPFDGGCRSGSALWRGPCGDLWPSAAEPEGRCLLPGQRRGQLRMGVHLWRRDRRRGGREAARHEAGRNVGLSRDGTASVGYYTGYGDWAPSLTGRSASAKTSTPSRSPERTQRCSPGGQARAVGPDLDVHVTVLSSDGLKTTADPPLQVSASRRWRRFGHRRRLGRWRSTRRADPSDLPDRPRRIGVEHHGHAHLDGPVLRRDGFRDRASDPASEDRHVGELDRDPGPSWYGNLRDLLGRTRDRDVPVRRGDRGSREVD